MAKIGLILFLVFSQSLLAQENHVNMKEMVQNSIMAFHISELVSKTSNNYDSYLLGSKYFKDGAINFFMNGQKNELELTIQPLPKYSFPNEEFMIYEVRKKGMNFYNSITDVMTTYSFGHMSKNHDKKYLIAIENGTGNILFISGDFLKTPIGSYFDCLCNMEEIKKFVMLKMYSIGIQNIINVKEKRKLWEVSFIDLNGNNGTIVVPKDYPDNIHIRR